MHDRFSKLGEYAASISVDGVLFTCSAFGSCIEKVQEELTVPVLKPNQALQEQIISSAKQGRTCVMSIFEPTLPSLRLEIENMIGNR
eukprot:CAMPEP_0184061522 /NCGR_PEP_ID=MMETSP0956-20121227/11556_1 /TAXON_ID=627963 /ORGANISM="Aplanochytrium sp, Strain PBS07" /LENGTH=86 /DNA_ID=CAMNT_0026358021 /DNA_START=278 /DNA_END=538 /DNA_ORIENTATION=+